MLISSKCLHGVGCIINEIIWARLKSILSATVNTRECLIAKLIKVENIYELLSRDERDSWHFVATLQTSFYPRHPSGNAFCIKRYEILQSYDESFADATKSAPSGEREKKKIKEVSLANSVG